jgi:hypothetical protein
MNVTRRVALFALSLVVLSAVVGIVLWFRMPPAGTGQAGPERGRNAAESAPPADDLMMPTSEPLIAAALKAGDITYEESLLARAYALYDDPRLEPLFRSPIVNWDAGMPLFLEVAANQAKLSRELLAALEPFRARPNDPISIFNRPREDVMKAQGRPPQPPWISEAVPFTPLRIWIRGSAADLKPYISMAGTAWRTMEPFFIRPRIPDRAGDPTTDVNPDGAIDIYMMPPNAIDPRTVGNTIGTAHGMARPAEPRAANTASGYLLVLTGMGPEQTIPIMAHELTHVAQVGIDSDEFVFDSWLPESTAKWVEYRVAKSLRYTPTQPYDLLDPTVPPPPNVKYPWPPLFGNLTRSLNSWVFQYQSWLLYESGAWDLGDHVAKTAWQFAADPGGQGIGALDDAMPLAVHFPRFAVRNWHEDIKPGEYLWETRDTTFRPHLRPTPVQRRVLAGPGTEQLTEEVRPVAARYYRYQFANTIRRVTFQNFLKDVPYAHVWAIRKIGETWEDPEDWSRDEQHIFCRDWQEQDLTELVIVLSNSHLRGPLPADLRPRLLAEDVGCPYVEGWATSRLRIKDDVQDMTYVSSRASLQFKPRTVQDQPGNVQYDLMPTAVTWTASGTMSDCKVAGQALVRIAGEIDQPLNPSQPAYGYLNIVGRDGGDFHSVEVSAVDSKAMMIKTCPGDPPSVSEEPFRVQYLLKILSQPNAHDGTSAAYRGKVSFDPERFQDQLPTAARNLVESLPEFKEFLSTARPGRMVYTFEYELKPRAGAPQAVDPRARRR